MKKNIPCRASVSCWPLGFTLHPPHELWAPGLTFSLCPRDPVASASIGIGSGRINRRLGRGGRRTRLEYLLPRPLSGSSTTASVPLRPLTALAPGTAPFPGLTHVGPCLRKQPLDRIVRLPILKMPSVSCQDLGR